MDTHGLRTRHRATALLGVTAALWSVFAVAALGGNGIAYAGVDVLSLPADFVPQTVADIVKLSSSWGVTVDAVAAEVSAGAAVAAGAAAAGAAVPAAAAVGAVLGTGVALQAAWHLGNEIGGALPCLSCTGVDRESTTKTYANGFSVTWTLDTSATPDRVTAAFTVPAGKYTTEQTMQGYYTATEGSSVPIGGWSTGVDGSSRGPGTWTISRDACAGGCGYGETAFFSGGCLRLLNGSAVMLRAPYGGAGSACTTLVNDMAGSSSGLQQTPTAESGGGSGTTPNHTLQLVTVSAAQCRPAAGGALYTVTATSAAFTDTSTLPPILVPACTNPLDTRVQWTVKVHPLDGSFPDKTILETGTLPGTVTGHPEWAPCLPGGAQYPCLLTLTRILPDGTTRPYDPELDYQADPANWPSTDPESWLCRWGTLKLVVAECRVIYEQKPRVNAPPAPVSGENCMHGAISWNPINWVYVPVKCALKWAFVPPAGTFENAFADVDFCDNAVGVLACAVADLVEPWTHLGEGGASDCEGGAIGVPVLDPRTTGTDPDLVLHPWSACSSAAQAISSFWIPFSSALVYFGAFLLGARTLSRTIGADSPV